MRYRSFSSADTKRLGSDLGRRILEKGPGRKATVLALFGELGSGKTTFVQGLVRGLGARGKAVSPTFVLMRRMPMRGKFAALYHLDAYRLVDAGEAARIGIRGLLDDPKNILAVEWPERIQKILSKNCLRIRFQHGIQNKERNIQIPRT